MNISYRLAEDYSLILCDKTFSGCYFTRATATFWGPVFGYKWRRDVCRNHECGLVLRRRAWCEMHVKSWNPDSATVGMRLHSSHFCILVRAKRTYQTTICNKRSSETTENLVYVYSNSKMATSVRDAYELNMFAWDNEDVQPVRTVAKLYCVAPAFRLA